MPKRLDHPRSRPQVGVSKRLGQNRNDEDVTAKLNEVYDTESSALEPVLQSIQIRSLLEDQRK